MGLLRDGPALLKTALKGAIGGCALYFAADTASDVYTFWTVRAAALERARAAPELAALVGEPFAPAPWYEGTLGFSHRDAVAHATFGVTGPRGGTDVVARAARRPGPRHNALYNALCGGEWRLVSLRAMFPADGGLAAPRDLMAPVALAAAFGGGGGAGGGGGTAAAAAAAGGECLPCQQKQQQQQQQQPQSGKAAAAAASSGGAPAAPATAATAGAAAPSSGSGGARSWWGWLWGGSGGGSGGSGQEGSSGGSGNGSSDAARRPS